jgi:hypothetical protein
MNMLSPPIKSAIELFQNKSLFTGAPIGTDVPGEHGEIAGMRVPEIAGISGRRIEYLMRTMVPSRIITESVERVYGIQPRRSPEEQRKPGNLADITARILGFKTTKINPDRARRAILGEMGEAASRYRSAIRARRIEGDTKGVEQARREYRELSNVARRKLSQLRQ